MNPLHLLPLLASCVSALSPAGWRTQSIYQVITDRFARTDQSTTASCDYGNYCGGTFQGLINKLDYIQGMGFTAIWISPVVANLNTSTPYGLPYHGYWAQDIYSINPKFGTPADLKALSTALHGRGMYLMVDVVTNHFGYNGNPSSVRYNAFNPFNDQSYYHPYCSIDYSDTTSIQNCWTGDATVSLPDLRTEDPTVQDMFNKWVAKFVSNYSIDGLRIDSAQQVNKAFFPPFVNASGVYAVGEVFNGGPSYLCDYQNYMPGVLDYATYFWMVRAFSKSSTSMSELANGVPWLQGTCADTTLMGNFMENHDNPRFPAFTNDSSLIANAVAYTILRDGIPIIYYGQEQGFSGSQDPYNREPFWPSGYDTNTPLYKLVGKLNAIRNLAIYQDSSYASTKSAVAYTDAHTLVLRKGGSAPAVISVFTNSGAGSLDRSLNLASSLTGLQSNTAVRDVLTCNVFYTDAAGNLVVKISNDLPLALTRADSGPASYVCGSAPSSSSSSTSSAPASTSKTSSSTTVIFTSTSITLSTKSTSTTPAASTKSTSSSVQSTISSSSAKPTSSSSTTSSTSPKPSSTSSSTSSTVPKPSTSSSTPVPSSTSISTQPPTCPSSNSTLYSPSSSSPPYQILCSLDFPTSDLSSTSSPSLATCLKLCSNTPFCTAASYASGTCYLKTSAPDNFSVQNSNVITGRLLPGSYPPLPTCPSTNLEIYTPPASSSSSVAGSKKYKVHCGTDFSGNDLQTIYVNHTASSSSGAGTGLAECMMGCSATKGCNSGALSRTACYLKGLPASMVTSGGDVNGGSVKNGGVDGFALVQG